jgi:hypothetical protein
MSQATGQTGYTDDQILQIKNSLPDWISPRFSWRKLGYATLRSMGSTIHKEAPKVGQLICIPASGDTPYITALPLTKDKMTTLGSGPANSKAEIRIFSHECGVPDMRGPWLAQASVENLPEGSKLRRRNKEDLAKHLSRQIWDAREFARAVFPHYDPLDRNNTGCNLSPEPYPWKYYAYRCSHFTLPLNASPLLAADPRYAHVRGDLFIVKPTRNVTEYVNKSRIAALSEDAGMSSWLVSEAGMDALLRVLKELDWKDPWSKTEQEMQDEADEEAAYVPY